MTIDVVPTIEDLTITYPCRDPQFSALSSVLGHSSLPSPPAICLTGFPASGKRTITRAFLESMAAQFVWVDCSETFTSALLFDRIVNKLKELGGGDGARVKGSGDVNNFVVEVHRALEDLTGKVILVLDKAHCLTQLNSDSLFSVLARLPTLSPSTSTKSSLTILFLTTFIPTRSLGGLPLPTIHFPSYSKLQLLKILSRYAPKSLYYLSTPPTSEGDVEPDELAKIWEGLNSAVIDTFGPGTTLDVPTILQLSTKLWPQFVQPVIQAGIYDEETDEIIFGRVDFVGLFAIGKRNGLFSGEEIVKRQSTLTTNVRQTGRYELPYYSKFLLVSAFLASYNPTTTDARIFSRDSGVKRKNRRPGQKSNRGIAKMSQRLVGPRAFDLERMIAIFHSITNYEVKQTVDIQMQVPTPSWRDGADEIATLGTLKLILRANRGDPLAGGGRWKVNVAEEEVRRTAGSVGFSLNDHMVD